MAIQSLGFSHQLSLVIYQIEFTVISGRLLDLEVGAA